MNEEEKSPLLAAGHIIIGWKCYYNDLAWHIAIQDPRIGGWRAYFCILPAWLLPADRDIQQNYALIHGRKMLGVDAIAAFPLLEPEKYIK
jgi:hypothetical protein